MRLSDIQALGLTMVEILVPSRKELHLLMIRLEELGYRWASGHAPTRYDPGWSSESHGFIQLNPYITCCDHQVGRLPLVEIDWETNSKPLGSEPRNNDGRESCFWCSIPTAKRGGGMYDVCPKCGR